MLMLIIEIWLTVAAWRKGWRGYALRPVAFAFVAGLFIGMGAGTSGRTLADILPLAVLLDLACIGVLIRLAIRGPQSAEVLSFAAAPAGVALPDDA
ncbi:MAG: hypothetical protein AAB225_24240 [Acidobacteriota bacterium]